jgi:perosamine synthetase
MARPMLDGREEELVLEVLRSGMLSLGPMVGRFEEAFAAMAGTRFAVSCSSGTTGLHLCVRALGIGPGDEVVTTPFSFVATANALLYEDATPVFADIDEETYNVDPDAAAAAVTSRTKALLPVHIFGESADMDPLLATAARHGLHVIEDAAEAVGTRYRGRAVGTFGHPAMFAFYPNKQMTTGEGGIVTTDDPDLYALMRSLINQGRADDGSWLHHVRLGYNYRLSDVACAIGLGQLERLEAMLALRERVAGWYDEALADVPVVRPARRDPGRTWFVYVVRVPEGADRDAVARRLAERGVASKPYLPAIHLQPFYAERFGYRPGSLPVCERVSASTLALPFFPQMSEGQVARVAEALRAVV